jgi:hypothetical protein
VLVSANCHAFSLPSGAFQLRSTALFPRGDRPSRGRQVILLISPRGRYFDARCYFPSCHLSLLDVTPTTLHSGAFQH